VQGERGEENRAGRGLRDLQGKKLFLRGQGNFLGKKVWFNGNQSDEQAEG
jgi:hypothetical protein